MNNLYKTYCTLVFIIAAMFFGEGNVRAEQSDTGIFTPVNTIPDTKESQPPTIIRSRLVSLDLNLMADQRNGFSVVANSLTLNLFPDVVLTAALDRVDYNPSGSYTWVGHVEGETSSFVTLVVLDGMMTGNVFLPSGKFYNIRPREGGLHATSELDRSKFLPNTGIHAPHEPGDAPAAPAKPDDSSSMRDNGSTVDILILYTTQARAAAGGTSQMSALIDQAVSITNTAFSVSGITPRLRLVYTEEINFNEGTLTSTQILDALTNGTGVFSRVAGLRNTYRADLVALFTSQLPDACGIAWQGSAPYDEARGFSVNLANCSGDNYTLPHEVGHNMGGGHTRSEGTPAGSEGGAYDYSYAYIDTTGNFRTMMATGPGTLIPQFSNPQVNYNGRPTGVASDSSTAANNALSLNTSALAISQYRNTVPSVATGNFSGDSAFSFFSISMNATTQSTSFGSVPLNSGTFLNSNNSVAGSFQATGFTLDGVPLLFYTWEGKCPGGFFLTMVPQSGNSNKLDVNVLSSLDCGGEAAKQTFTMSRSGADNKDLRNPTPVPTPAKYDLIPPVKTGDVVTGDFVGDGSYSFFSISMSSYSKTTGLGTMNLAKGTFLNSNNNVSGTFDTTGFTTDGTALTFFTWTSSCSGGFFITITPQSVTKLSVSVLDALDCTGRAGKQTFTMTKK